MEDLTVRSAEQATDEDHYSVLSRMVATVSHDHTQLRSLVYEFARRQLRRNLYPQFEDGDWSGIQQRLHTLEVAIEQVESDYTHQLPPSTFVSEPPLTYQYSTDDGFGDRPASPKAVTLGVRNALARFFSSSPPDNKYPSPLPPMSAALQPMSDGDIFFAVARFSKQPRSTFWWRVQLSVAVLLGVVIYAAIDGRSALSVLGLLFNRPDAPATVSTANTGNTDANVSPDGNARTSKDLRPRTPGIPVPNEYGAFALSKGQLTELDVLPMRVPDQRVAISPVISTPSRTHLPAAKLEFVVFRRDLAYNAPDRVALRVVAQVVRALTFDAGGKATTTNIENSWVVRSNSYQMRVAPVADNPEMILIRPDPADLALPAGRYVLVLKNVAYDFTLDGPQTDAAHCLERTDALNTPVYTECRI